MDNQEKIKKILLNNEDKLNPEKLTSRKAWIENVFNENYPRKNSGIAPIYKSFEIIFEEGQKEIFEEVKKLLTKAEQKLDEHNGDYGEKGNLCLCCNSGEYDSIVGILHYPHCIIRKIRERLIKNDEWDNW